jgi:signal transduction histidine kinase
MSSKLSSKLFKQIGPRLIFGFCSFFVGGSACVFFIVYTLFLNSLAAKDHEIITSKAKEYVTLYREHGVDGLNNIALDSQLRDDASDFLIRLGPIQGKARFLHLPAKNKHFDLAQIESKLSEPNKNGEWSYFRSRDDDDSLEVLTLSLADGNVLQVGKSSDEREDLGDSLEQTFMLALLITLIFSAGAGTLFSRRVLKPIRNLISTIEEIQTGDLNARVPNSKTSDELENLTRLFNEMLDRIHNLIVGMRETLDNVAHDLRTPMTRLRAIAEHRLSAGQSSSAEEYREALTEALENSTEILTMLDSLMDISEAEAGAMKLKMETFQGDALLKEVADLYDIIADDKGVSLTAQCENGLVVFADRTRLKQVLANLVDNAVKYTKAGGKIAIKAKLEGEFLKFEVSDTGIGIDEKDLPRIFDRLYRGDSSRSERGLGLGLSLISSIAKAHGGLIAVKTQVGVGSTFQLKLKAPFAANGHSL